MGWSLRVHTDNMTKEGMPALLNKVANVTKACLAGNVGILDFMKPAHAKNPSLAAHVKCLQMAQVCFGRGPCLGRIQQNWHDECHIQTQLSCQEECGLTPDAFQIAHISSCNPDTTELLGSRAVSRADRATKIDEALHTLNSLTIDYDYATTSHDQRHPRQGSIR